MLIDSADGALTLRIANELVAAKRSYTGCLVTVSAPDVHDARAESIKDRYSHPQHPP